MGALVFLIEKTLLFLTGEEKMNQHPLIHLYILLLFFGKTK